MFFIIVPIKFRSITIFAAVFSLPHFLFLENKFFVLFAASYSVDQAFFMDTLVYNINYEKLPYNKY